MQTRSLGHILRQNMRRNIKHLALSAFGIVVGIAAFVFFWGLSGGVSRVVLHDIFPIDRVEVVAPRTSFTGIQVALDDALVQRIAARPEVKSAFPKMQLGFPAKGWGKMANVEVRGFEIGGFCDGIDPALVAGQSGLENFQDWEEIEKGKLAACSPEPENACPQDRYCGWDRLCHHRVPVLVSRVMLEMYNGFAPSHGMPRIGAAQEALIAKYINQVRFTVDLGESILPTSMRLAAAPEQVEAQLIGLSDRAMRIGMTVPIGYVKRWNERWLGPNAARSYSSIVVNLKDRADLSSFVAWVKREGYEQEESQAERIALVISIVTALFLVIAFVICGISAVNISHTFFMLVSERRRELGLMRAVGASRADIWRIILGEAAVLGLVGGGLGIGLALAAAKIIDYFSRSKLPDYPFKPSTYFQFSPTLIAAALAFAVLFCILGAALPARKAARIHPAQALQG